MTTESLKLTTTMQRGTTAETTESGWRTLYLTAAAAAIGLVLLTFFQAYVFIAWPPPSFQPTADAARDWFSLLQANPLIGLLDLDLAMLVDYPLSLLVFLALYAALGRNQRSLATIALALGICGVASYFAANPAFSMLALGEQYAAAATEAQRTMLLAAGQSALAIFEGSAFNASYILIAIAGLIMCLAMLRSTAFGRPTTYIGIVFYAMNLVPASAGALGFVLSLASLVPMIAWLILLARSFFRLARAEGR